MAVQNGIIKGDQAAKLESYPVLSNDAGDFLTGSGTWQAMADATTVKSGFMPAADKAFLAALLSGSLATPTANTTTGALEYKYNNVVILSIPVASGS